MATKEENIRLRNNYFCIWFTLVQFSKLLNLFLSTCYLLVLIHWSSCHVSVLSYDGI